LGGLLRKELDDRDSVAATGAFSVVAKAGEGEEVGSFGLLIGCVLCSSSANIKNIEPDEDEPVLEPVVDEPVLEPVVDEPVDPVLDEPVLDPVLDEPVLDSVLDEYGKELENGELLEGGEEE